MIEPNSRLAVKARSSCYFDFGVTLRFMFSKYVRFDQARWQSIRLKAKNSAKYSTQNIFRIERKKNLTMPMSAKAKAICIELHRVVKIRKKTRLCKKGVFFGEMNQRSLSVVTNSPNISRNWLSSAVMIMFFEILLEINSLVDLLPSICGLKFVSSRDMLSRQSVCFLLLELPSQTFFLSLSSDSCLVTFFTNLISNIANWCQVQRVE